MPLSVTTRLRAASMEVTVSWRNSTLGLADVPVGQPYVIEATPPEHHVQLRETEDERVALVDESDLDVVAEILGEPGRELQAAEPGSEDQNSGRHVLAGPRYLGWGTMRM